MSPRWRRTRHGVDGERTHDHHRHGHAESQHRARYTQPGQWVAVRHAYHAAKHAGTGQRAARPVVAHRDPNEPTTIAGTQTQLANLAKQLNTTRTDVAALSSSAMFQQLSQALGLDASRGRLVRGRSRCIWMNKGPLPGQKLWFRGHAVLHESCAVGRLIRARRDLQA